jgi:hypothetical protein
MQRTLQLKAGWIVASAAQRGGEVGYGDAAVPAELGEQEATAGFS